MDQRGSARITREQRGYGSAPRMRATKWHLQRQVSGNRRHCKPLEMIYRNHYSKGRGVRSYAPLGRRPSEFCYKSLILKAYGGPGMQKNILLNTIVMKSTISRGAAWGHLNTPSKLLSRNISGGYVSFGLQSVCIDGMCAERSFCFFLLCFGHSLLHLG